MNLHWGLMKLHWGLMSTRPAELTHIQLRTFQPADLPALVDFWNRAFARRRSFSPLTQEHFRKRILDCPAFDPSGLILAFHRSDRGSRSIAGLVHAFRPPPDTAAYNRWGRYHSIALLYVAPQHRRQGAGSRLLKAAENWLYYCPVHFAGQVVPCYGSVEGPRPPLFGSTQRMGVSANDTHLLHFLANRGYSVVDPGDISMTVDLLDHPPARTGRIDPATLGLRLQRISHNNPFNGIEPADRAEYSAWGDNHGFPYTGHILVDNTNQLRGHLCWFPVQDGKMAGIYAFWLAPQLRGRGLGSLLLDTALADMAAPSPPGGPYQRAEVQTHLVRHTDAVALYESRGFQIDEAWVTLVKT
jgi:GNAT superfamily N-acetyltransferase